VPRPIQHVTSRCYEETMETVDLLTYLISWLQITRQYFISQYLQHLTRSSLKKHYNTRENNNSLAQSVTWIRRIFHQTLPIKRRTPRNKE